MKDEPFEYYIAPSSWSLFELKNSKTTKELPWRKIEEEEKEKIIKLLLDPREHNYQKKAKKIRNEELKIAKRVVISKLDIDFKLKEKLNSLENGKHFSKENKNVWIKIRDNNSYYDASKHNEIVGFQADAFFEGKSDLKRLKKILKKYTFKNEESN